MILYQPLFDAYHCSFRLLLLLTKFNEEAIEEERLRIYDFLMLYPSFLYKVKLPQAFVPIRKSIKVNQYNSTSSEKVVFERLRNMQNISLNALASTSLIDMEKLKDGQVVRTDVSLPQEILDRIANQSLERLTIINFLRDSMGKLSLKELKERTKLIEYKYDKN
ncbi:MAG: ABC-three component system middle component 5 [Bacteroidota bacterium]